MQSVSPRIWTRAAVSISYDDNHYTNSSNIKQNNSQTLGHVGEYYGPNFSCTESTSYPEKKKILELDLLISVKNIWVLFGCVRVHPVDL